MSPTRRVLLAIGVLVLTLVTGLLVSWHVQTRALGAALVADIQASLTRTIERNPKPAAPNHENGYACFASVVEAMPADVAPFDQKSSAALAEMMDAGVISDTWKEKVERLEPWAATARDCADSAWLKYVPGVTPFTGFSDARSERGNQTILALSRLERLRARVGAAPPEVVTERCAATLELALERGRVNLIGAMIAAAAVRQLAPSCGEALQHLSPESRPQLAARMEQLHGRLSPNHELMERERLLMSLELFSWTLNAAERDELPEGDHMLRETLANPAHRFVLARVWGRWDRAMRRLSASADAPGPARQDASRALDEVFDAWWIPAGLSVGGPSYDKFLVRNEETALLLQLLSDLAQGGERPLPAQVTREEEGLVFTNFQGERLIIAR